MLFPWLYEEMDKEIAKAKPIIDININKEDIPEQIPIEIQTPIVQLPHEIPPQPSVISEPSTSEPPVPSEPTTSSPPVESSPSTTVPKPGRNVQIGVSDGIVATDK